jgi:hypothetical protein
LPKLAPKPPSGTPLPDEWFLRIASRLFRAPFLDARERLFLVVVFRSFWGQRGVELTLADMTEIGVSKQAEGRALRVLEKKGWVRVERRPGHAAPTVWPILLAA